jgi:hypothetical protein
MGHFADEPGTFKQHFHRLRPSSCHFRHLRPNCCSKLTNTIPYKNNYKKTALSQ